MSVRRFTDNIGVPVVGVQVEAYSWQLYEQRPECEREASRNERHRTDFEHELRKIRVESARPASYYSDIDRPSELDGEVRDPGSVTIDVPPCFRRPHVTTLLRKHVLDVAKGRIASQATLKELKADLEEYLLRIFLLGELTGDRINGYEVSDLLAVEAAEYTSRR